MPKRLRIKNHLSGEELESRYRSCQEVAERRRWEVIWLLWNRTPSEYVRNRTQLSVEWIRTLARRYNQHGPDALKDKRRELEGAPPLLNAQQQEQLAAALEEPVPDELGGGLWNGPKVAAWMSLQLGRPVHRRRGHHYLRASGYTCQTPRPRHHKGDPVAQDEFKKNSFRS